MTCSLAQANVGFVANQITSLRNSRCSRENAWHCCLVGFGFQEFHEAARAMRSEGVHQILQKLWGSPEERLPRKLRENGLRGSPAWVGPRLHCRGPPGCTVWADRPDCAIAPRLGQSGPVNCTKLASPSFALDTVAIRIVWKTGVEP